MAYRNQQIDSTQFDYKKPQLLREYLDDEYQIRPRRQTNLSSPEQRRLTTAIKRARHLALLPYTASQTE
jgi:small subunit ribosomal protein S18